MDYVVARQLKALNGQARTALYIGDTAATTLSTNAYRVEFLTAGRIKSITNSIISNDSDMTSADTLEQGAVIKGRTSAITLGAGKVIAYCAGDAFFAD